MDSEVIVTNEIQAIYPANSLQQGFIFHAVSQPLDDAYVVQSLCDYHHEINVDAYRQAWALAIKTYPTLRLCFNWDESPIQIITKQGELHFFYHDLSIEADKEKAILELQQNDRKHGFDLSTPSLLRLHLIKQSNNHYTLLKTEHHSIADAWSAAVLLNQVHHFYHRLMSGITPTIMQDTAYLQAQAYISKHQTEAQQHWRKTIEAIHQANDVNALFTRHAKPEALNNVKEPHEITIELDPMQYDRLKKLVHDEAITLHGLVQFAWHKMLHTYTGDAQTIVGTTVSGRALPITDIEKSVGLYINTLPLVVDWNNSFTIKEQLQHIHQTIMGLNKYSFVYLSTLQSDGNRLFNSLLLFENLSFSSEKLVSETNLIAANRRGIQKLNYPLALTLHVKNNTLCINFKYDGTYINSERANLLLKQLLLILQQIPCKLHAPHHTMDLLTPEESQQILHTWNSTNAPYPDDKTLHDLFETQVLRTPNAIALVFEGQRLTYRELDAKANQLAHYLHEKGLCRGELVTLCLDRSLELMIAILGVLKAGCAYVPIDPDYPLERISYVLKNTESHFLLTQGHHATRLETIIESHLNCISLDEKPYQMASHARLEIPRAPTDLAYVIYTSGTTGNPKGVAITHSGAVNRLHWMQCAYPLDEHDAVLQKTPYSFDVSVWELLWAHWTGAKIVIARPDGHKDPQYLHQVIQDEKVTVLHFVPSMLAAFTEALTLFKLRVPDSLRTVFCSGEALFANQVDAFYKISADTVLIHNLYGPTEASIDVTAFTCHRGVENVYIGRPIQNTRVYVLTPHLKPVPVGAVGELYLGGVGLAREYWNQPTLTAASFINNPMATENDLALGYNRLYKTGDRVRWHADGNIEYLGRADSQVKIRGLRIELSEIEQVMLAYPEISQAVALVKEHVTPDYTHRFIAAYYVGKVTEKVLRIHMAAHLPDYMIPTSLMSLPSFPITNNGKLNRKALPVPAFMMDATQEITAPRNTLEKTLCEIWKTVLKVPQVNITDNFFDLGGDSIRSIRLVGKMEAIGFYVSVNDLFKYKTILQLVEHTQHTVTVEQEAYVPFSLVDTLTRDFAIKTNASIEDVYPASYLQIGMLVESLKSTADGAYHDVFSYTINRPFKSALLLDLFKTLSAKHPLLRTAFVEHPNYGYLCTQYADIDITTHFGGVIEENIPAFIQSEKSRAFTIDKPGLFSLFALNPTENQFTLVFSFHHAITDGWSVASLMSELMQAYVNGKFIILQETIPPYQRVIQQEQLALTSNEHALFWRDYLANAPLPPANLLLHPTSEHNKPIEIGSILDDIKSAAVLSNAKRLGVSPDTLFLTAYSKTLSRFFNQNDVIIGLVMNNRLEAIGGDKVFGLHLNTLPLRIKINENSAALTQYLFEQKTHIEKYKAYPYGKIRSDITEGSDIYTCAFNYMHFHMMDSASNSSTAGPSSVFEKTTIPLTFHVSRYRDHFRMAIKAPSGFIDHETATQVLAYLQHDLNAIIHDVEFSWLLEDDKIRLKSTKQNRILPQKKQKTVGMQEPRNALEKSLCEIWQSVLMIPRIGITDNFFELGGDSIRSIRLIAKMQESGFYVSVNDLFKHKTILALLENVNQNNAPTIVPYLPFSLVDETTRSTISLENKHGDIDDIYPAGYLQMGMLVESLKAEAKGAYHDVFAYTIHRLFNEMQLLTLFKKLSIKHPLLRTAFAEHAEYGYLCIQYADLDIASHYRGIIEEDVLPFIDAEKNRVFSIDQPGLFSLFVLNPSDDQFILVFSFHHAIADGWSVASLISEFSAAYSDSKEIIVETIPPYQRVIQQEREALTLNKHEKFWRDYLFNVTLPISDLVLNPNALKDKNLEIGCIFDNEKSSAILLFAKHLGVSPDTLFLSAYFKTLSRFFNQNDITIGLVIHNRLEEAGGDKIVGLHLNTLPLRIWVDENSTTLTQKVSEQKIQLDQYKAYPYGKIRSDIMQGNDVYTCAFNYIHFHITDEQLDSKTLSATQVFEKTTIPFTLHVSRHHNAFRIAIKALNGFIDHKTADQVLDYIQHDLTAIINNMQFSWISADHVQLFARLNQTPILFHSDEKQASRAAIKQPRNALEKSLCDAWQSILNISHIGITDNFFELGGDSIRGIRLVAKMHEIGFYVSIADIFQYKTILQLVENVKQSISPATLPYVPFSLIDIETQKIILNRNEIDHIEDIYPVGYLQMGMLLESLKPAAKGAYHDVFAYKIHRPLNETRLLTLFKKLCIKHPLLRTAFIEHAEYGYVSVQHADIDIAAHYSSVIQENVTAFINREKNRSLTIDKPGLFHLFALNPTENEFVLVFSFHHAITDGWSVASLMSEFTKSYSDEKDIDTETIPLYQRVIQQERLSFTSNTHEAFWREYLENTPLPIHDLVFHPNAPIAQEFETGSVLEDIKSNAILSTSKQLGVSPDTLFLAAYFKTLSRFSNQSDLIIGLVMNNRLAEMGGDKVFGLHLNTLPLRQAIHDNSTTLISDLSQQRASLEAYKAYPYGKIRNEITKTGDLYTCAFNYIHFHVMDTQTEALNTIQVFEKTSIPFTLQVSRHRDSFRIAIKALNGFIDHETAEYVLQYIQHDLDAIIHHREFTWLSAEHQSLFHAWHKNHITDHQLRLKESVVDRVKPRNTLEKTLCDIWKNVLGVHHISISDNFFELGGDSIRIIRLIAKMQEVGFYASIGDVFKYKTILQLIENVKQTTAPTALSYTPFSLIDKATEHLIVSKNPAIEDVYPAGYLQMRMLLESFKVESNGTYHDVFAYTIQRSFNETLLLSVFKGLMVKHPLLRTAFVEHAEYGYICVQHLNADIADHYGGVIHESVSSFIDKEKNRHFKIDHPGLFCFFVLNPTEDQFVLIFSFHHAITDGWSIASMMSEWMSAYANEKAVAIETIPPYQRVIQQERSALTSNTHKAFWRDYLAGASLQTSHFILPSEKQRSQQLETARVLDNKKSSTILSTAKRLGVSPDTVFLAAYFKAVSQLFNHNDVVLGVVMNNRLEEADADKVFGLHLNILPLRMHIDPKYRDDNDAFISSLADERLRVVPHKAYPYAKLCLDLNAPSGFYSCAFNYTHFHVSEHHTKEKLIQPLYAFEKMSIPLTLQISRYQDTFRLIIRASYQFIDDKTANALLDLIHNEL